MQKVIKFRRTYKYYIDLVYAREKAKDYWGVLDAIKNAKSICKNRQDKKKLDMMMAQTYYEMEQYEKSSNCFFRLAPTEIFRASAFFGVGRNLVCQKHYDLALDYFDACIKWDVLNVFSEAVLEWISYIKDEMDFEKENLLILSAKRLIQCRNIKKAKQILGEMKTSSKTLELLSFCELCEEDFSAAKQKAKEALIENPNSSIAIIVLLRVYEKEGAETKSLKRKLLELKPKTKEDIKRVGLFLAHYGDFEHAVWCFDKLCKLDQFNPLNHLFCGLCLYNLKKEQDALMSVGKSMWLDEENPIYSFFYDAIKTHELGENVKLDGKLPKDIEKEKVENLLQIFFGGNLNKELNKSYNLLNDIIWSYSLNDFSLTEKTTQSLIASKNKKAICLVKKLMLSTGPTVNQKFTILKEAIKNEIFVDYNFVCKHVYSSFRLGKNELKMFAKNFLEGVSSAISYVECFYPKLMLVPKVLKYAQSLKTNTFFKNMSAKIIACSLLKNHEEVFFDACEFFGVDKTFVKDVFDCSEICGVQNEN